MVRPPCCDRLNYQKRDWSEDDDTKIIHYVSSKHGTRKPESSTGMKKCGKSCKVKWSNNESFSEQEEELIIKLHAAVGSRWAIIAHQLPGRTDNDIKNHWNTKLRKKLSERGIDPVTHKPFSQILADYGKIGGLSRAASTVGGSCHIGTIKRDLKKVASFTLPKPELSSSSSTFLTYENISTITTMTMTTTNDSSNNSLDLLSQLQAITLVTERANSENNYNNSPLSEFTKAYDNEGKAESFSWNEFLLDDTTTKVAKDQEQEFDDDIGCVTASSKPRHMTETGNGLINGYYPFQGVDLKSTSTSMSSTSQASSFLEAMLDQEDDMFLNFPGLMEDSLY